jgi:GAF domain-containing protein
VVRLLKVKGATLLLYKKAEKTLELASSYGLSEQYLQKGVMLSEKSIPAVLNTAEPTVVQQEDFDTRLQYPAEARQEGIAAIMSVPLKLDETVLGVLRIYSSEKLTLSDEEKDLLLKFAEQGARALENAMAYERVRADIEGIKRGVPSTVAKRM